jgi:hypothetical protein
MCLHDTHRDYCSCVHRPAEEVRHRKLLCSNRNSICFGFLQQQHCTLFCFIGNNKAVALSVQRSACDGDPTLCYDDDCVTSVYVWFGFTLEYGKSECCLCDRPHHHLIIDHQFWNSQTRGFLSNPRRQQKNRNLATNFWNQRPFGNCSVIILSDNHLVSLPVGSFIVLM